MSEAEEKRKAPLWKPMSSAWMSDDVIGLRSFKHGRFTSSNTAALMVLYAMCIHSPIKDDPIKGVPHHYTDITYNELVRMIGISKLLVSRGIKILEEKGLITKKKVGRKNIYRIENLEMKKGSPAWCKIPFRYFTSPFGIKGIFSGFDLRNRNSLNAIKFYFLLLKERIGDSHQLDRKHGKAISYDNIVEKLGVQREDIREMISILERTKLVYCEKIKLEGFYVKEKLMGKLS